MADPLIEYCIEGIISDPTLPDIDKVERWLTRVAQQEGSTIQRLTYIFADDEFIRKVNQDHLDHDYYTDIITFPYQEGEDLESDLFISIDRVLENAKLLQVDYMQELLRVMVHGVLHLIGYGDKTTPDQDKMRAAEDKAIALYDELT